MTNGPLGQCNTCGEIYHHSPVVQHVCTSIAVMTETATDIVPRLYELTGTYGVADEAVAAIMRLRTALTASLAREAAAFEAAAKVLEDTADQWSCGHDSKHCDCARDIEQWRFAADDCRALTPADAQAALGRMINAARADGMRVALTWGGMDGDAANRAVKSILAKIGGVL